MNYSDWGSDAHWYYSIPFNNNTTYNWSVIVSNNCNSSNLLGYFQLDVQI